MNLADLLVNWAQQAPERAALIHGKQQHSFASLEQASSRAASMLRQHDIQVGENILVLMPMGIPLYEVLLACWRCGACVIIVDPAAGAEAFAEAIKELQPKAFIASSKAMLLRWRYPSIRTIPLVWSTGMALLHRSWRRHRKAAEFGPPEDLAASAPALITFTSGSTGRPKGAVRSHGLLAAQHCAIAQALEHQEGAIELATLPIFALASLASGMTTVIPPVDLGRVGLVDGKLVRQCIAKHKVTSVTASPAFFNCLMEGGALPIKRAYTGGAPVFPGFWQGLDDLLPHGEAVALYGSTEAEPIAHSSWSQVTSDDHHKMSQGKGLLTGRVVDQTELYIVKHQAPPGPWSLAELKQYRQASYSPGEIIVTGDHVLPGYLGGRGDQEAKISIERTIFHRTGDAGYLDAQQRLWLLGRCAAVINDEHGILYPFAIEAAAMSCDSVRRAACMQHNGARLLVVEGQLDQQLQQQLRNEFHLSQIIFMTIPVDKRHNAKVDYPLLRKLL